MYAECTCIMNQLLLFIRAHFAKCCVVSFKHFHYKIIMLFIVITLQLHVTNSLAPKLTPNYNPIWSLSSLHFISLCPPTLTATTMTKRHSSKPHIRILFLIWYLWTLTCSLACLSFDLFYSCLLYSLSFFSICNGSISATKDSFFANGATIMDLSLS